ncbi:TPA: tail fiber domain-containing protein [Streptococcus pneumoniae]|uniref:phage tail spike protein n=18 Tax=Streptococcus pneumoniae TaxID=1313 RepID=UPI001952CED5|nr:tail fiber domain-containing protein [Streptococcus pneumoniae]HEU6782698.1 tail fiber domain-containing protein [Streptococcus pneumoniae]HEU9146524.1 tail fiber domain-containing protein [Streptococcus pneumoniae]HEV0024059.1 tail fiber domain-containing protein [Streptococcus pneumoniae]HEV0589246.1 tail fiber domain-containing protein [Streptococcus pneumoniae]
MLYLLNKDVRTVRWNGEPLHEATSAIVKEIMNGDFTLTVKYPISDSGIYQLIQEDMLIKAPTPVLGAQLFRIKKPVEYNDHLEITAYHISDDVMQRSITPVSVTSQSCGMTLSRMIQNTKTALGDFSFNSDIQDRRTFNTTETETLYSILLDGKHSIVGTWEGELVRDNFAMTVKKSRGENRGVVITTHKNLKNYQRTKNSQNVVTRIHAKSTFKPEGAEKETTIRVTVDSPLINSYPYINEKEYENNNAKTVEELQKWAQSKFSNEGIDKVSDAIKIEAYELDGQVVHMGDTVNLKSWKHNVDAFKKAIAYEFDALKEEYISLTFDDKAGIGGSRASGGLSSAADAILGVTESAQEIALEKALQNADLDFDHKAGLLRQEISDDIELAKARAEEVKRELSDTINQRFNSFDNGPLKETKRKAEEALRNAGASTLLAQEAKRIGLDSVARLEAFKSQTTSAQTALSGDLDVLKRTIANDIRPKQAQAEAEIAKQVEALSRTKNELSGASTLLAQEAKRIELDSVARLEAFKSQTTSAQTALSGDLDVLKRTIANDIRPKQAQAEAEIAKQVEVLSRTKNELSGVKSAQATYEETTTRRLSELTNLANGKASKSELTQTAEELASRIASVQASGRNLFLNSLFKQDISKTGIWTTSTYTAAIDSESKHLGHKALKIIGLNPSGRDGGNPKVTYPALGQFGKVIPGSTTNQDVTISFYAKANKNGIMLRSRLGNIGYKTGNVTLSTEIKRYVVHIPKGWTNESKQTTNEWLFNFNQEGTVWIWMPKFEISDVDTSYSEAPEDVESQISTVESTFKQRADSLDAGVNRLTEGLRTKVDISSLNVTAENIRQSVKSLETDTQNKLNQKLSQAEFEVRAGSIRQEILNATKDKASKSELTQTAEELASKIASVQASGRNLFLNSLFKQDISKTGIWTTSTYTATIDSESKYLGHKALKIIGLNPSGRDGGNPKVTYPALGQFGKVIPGSTTNQDVTISFYAKANKNGIMLRSRLGNIGYKTGNVTLSTEIKRYVVHIPKGWTNESKQTTNEWLFNFNQEGTVWIWMPKFEISDVDTSYSEAPEDIEGQISTVESTFKQRANSLEAGVSRLTEGLRTKADISSLNVTAENIRQSVKSLETDTQNKLNQKLSQAEFEVRAGSIRQEILNATKDKASKSELTQTAEELASKIASVQVGGRNYIRGTKRMMLARGLWASGTFRPSGAGTAKTIDVSDSPATGFDKAIRLTSSNARDQIGIAQDGFYISQGTYTMSCWVKGRRGQKVKLQTYWQVNDNSGISPIFTLKDENWTKLSFTSARNRAGVASIGYVYLVNAEVGEYLDVLAPQLEDGSLATSSKEAPEDIEGQISTVESTFKQRANSLEAGVNRLTEGLRTKADISSLNVTAENIRQSVKSLETDTQNKLNQKLSQAEFEVRAGSIRQEILNATKDKASKSELTQTAEELSSKIASVQASGRNLFLNSLFKQDISKTGIWTTSTYTAAIDSESKYLGHKALKIIGLNPSGRDGGNPKVTYPALGQFGKVIPGSTTNQDVTISFYAKANKNGIMLRSRLGNIGYKTGNVTLSTEIKRYVVHIPKGWTNESKQTTNEWLFNFNQEGTIWIWMPKFEISDVDTSYSEAPEDIEGQISTVESTFKQRANSLDAGVSRLTEGLRTKADISSLNVTAENIRQSVKSLETDTQNKLNQKLSQAEFEVRAGSIRQEILNATKDKADKTLVVSEAGKLREEFSKMKVGGRNLWIKSKTVGAVIEKLPENHVTGQKECYRLENNSTLTFNLEPDFSSRLYQKVTFSAWIKYENVVQGRNFWNVFNCFKHYLFRKNSETGVQSGPDYATLGMYKGSADWKYITFTYDYSEKTNFDQLKTSLRFNLEGATSGTAWVTGIKVEIGSVATDWSPAPEDADGLITEAKATFERTAQGLRTDLSAIQEYVNKDGQRQEALQRYTREESTRQATAVRELVNRDFVGKATYQEDVKGINQRIEAVKTSANKDIASQIASYRQSVDGKFTDISSQITTYKQDVGGQISGLSNRLTSSEQGTTTQISNISNRINSNKQGTDNQISNLKTQVATNKDNAERQMGRISDQVSANKANADSQFVNVTNQLARKVETTDFQRVKETSKLYERILGNTENGIADKVARMALTNQLFQVEVGKVAKGGRNYIRNGQFKNGSKNWLEYQSVNFGLNFNYQHSQNPNNRNRPGLHFYHDSQDVANFFGIQQSFAFDGVRGEKVSVSLLVSKDGGDSNSGLKVALHYIKNKNIIGQEWQNIPSPQITSKYKRFTFTFTLSDDVENLNLMLFGEKGKTINLYVTDVQLERGSVATDYKEAPEDTDEAIRSVQSQLAGSWAVENINSAGDIISGINLGANGHNRFVGKLTHITGETLIDRAVIKSAMVDKLKTANFEAGSVTTTILEAEAVTAEKLKVDNALIKKLTATDAFIDQLTSKRIFSIKIESVISSSTFLEAYQGRIGGFTLGQFDQGGGRWISGVNQFSVGMGNGAGYGVRTAFWANWGNNWNYAGPKAWNVNTDGKMYCRNEVGFYDQVDFSNSSRANFYGNTTFSRSPVFSNGIELGSKDVLGDGWNPKGGRNAVVWWNQVGSGSVKYWMEQKSDRRLKENITDTAVKALDKINRLRMVAFDFIENKKHEEIGLIAQEAETIVPRIVSRDPENPDGYLHIDYTALVPYLIKAIQELNQKIEKMEKTIA